MLNRLGGRAGANMGRAIVFSCKYKREGQTIWCMLLRGEGHYFLCKVAGVKESILNSSVVTVYRFPPDLKKQYIVEIEREIYLFND